MRLDITSKTPSWEVAHRSQGSGRKYWRAVFKIIEYYLKGTRTMMEITYNRKSLSVVERIGVYSLIHTYFLRTRKDMVDGSVSGRVLLDAGVNVCRWFSRTHH